MKSAAKGIISSVNEGKETVLTSVVHLSEVVNILKHRMRPSELVELVGGILTNESVRVEGVTAEDYLGAAESAMEDKVDPNDSLAVLLMKRRHIGEIYTFDSGFDNVEGVRRLPGAADGEGADAAEADPERRD